MRGGRFRTFPNREKLTTKRGFFRGLLFNKPAFVACNAMYYLESKINQSFIRVFLTINAQGMVKMIRATGTMADVFDGFFIAKNAHFLGHLMVGFVSATAMI